HGMGACLGLIRALWRQARIVGRDSVPTADYAGWYRITRPEIERGRLLLCMGHGLHRDTDPLLLVSGRAVRDLGTNALALYGRCGYRRRGYSWLAILCGTPVRELGPSIVRPKIAHRSLASRKGNSTWRRIALSSTPDTATRTAAARGRDQRAHGHIRFASSSRPRSNAAAARRGLSSKRTATTIRALASGVGSRMPHTSPLTSPSALAVSTHTSRCTTAQSRSMAFSQSSRTRPGSLRARASTCAGTTRSTFASRVSWLSTSPRPGCRSAATAR